MRWSLCHNDYGNRGAAGSVLDGDSFKGKAVIGINDVNQPIVESDDRSVQGRKDGERRNKNR